MVHGEVSTLEAAAEGVMVHGLYMQGMQWKWNTPPEAEEGSEEAMDLTTFDWGGALVDESPGRTTTPCPVLHFLPDENHAVEDDVYVCPCYKTARRSGTLGTSGISTNFVLAVELPSEQEKDYWVLRGAALVCSDDSE